MRTLMTGFGPFENTIHNPSARIVDHFERSGAPGHELTTRVLPVSFIRAEAEIRSLLHSGGYDAAVLLGVAGREACIRLEQFARLRKAGRADVDGMISGMPERLGGAPDAYGTILPLDMLLDGLTVAELPARLSDDAGAYVCNHVYYAALDVIATVPLPTRCLFVHVPADEHTYEEPFDGPTLPFDRQIKAVMLILEWLTEREPAPVSGFQHTGEETRS
jgi:pyroglutamyl-peptidase